MTATVLPSSAIAPSAVAESRVEIRRPLAQPTRSVSRPALGETNAAEPKNRLMMTPRPASVRPVSLPICTTSAAVRKLGSMATTVATSAGVTPRQDTVGEVVSPSAVGSMR